MRERWVIQRFMRPAAERAMGPGGARGAREHGQRRWRRLTMVGGLLLAVGVALTATACDEKLSSIAGPTPGLEPTFASIHANILTASDSSGRSSCTQCHTNVGRNPAGRLNLAGDPAAAYAALVNRPSTFQTDATLVIPGDPENSYLIAKLHGTTGIAGGRMPSNGPPFLTDGQILVIERWIRNGAPSN